MDSEYLVRARLGMTGDIGGRPPGLGFRSISGSPSKTSYLLDGLPTSGANKRPRPVDADAVTLDNYHVSKRYLTEVSGRDNCWNGLGAMLCSWRGLIRTEHVVELNCDAS